MGIASPSTLSPTGVKGGSQYFSYPNNPRRRGAESNIGESLRGTLGCPLRFVLQLGQAPQELSVGWAPASALPDGAVGAHGGECDICYFLGGGWGEKIQFLKKVDWAQTPVEFPSVGKMSD